MLLNCSGDSNFTVSSPRVQLTRGASVTVTLSIYLLLLENAPTRTGGLELRCDEKDNIIH